MNYSKPYSVRLPEDLRAALEESAIADDRSLHRQMIYLLRCALRARGVTGAESHRAMTDHRPEQPLPTAHATQPESAS